MHILKYRTDCIEEKFRTVSPARRARLVPLYNWPVFTQGCSLDSSAISEHLQPQTRCMFIPSSAVRIRMDDARVAGWAQGLAYPPNRLRFISTASSNLFLSCSLFFFSPFFDSPPDTTGVNRLKASYMYVCAQEGQDHVFGCFEDFKGNSEQDSCGEKKVNVISQGASNSEASSTLLQMYSFQYLEGNTQTTYLGGALERVQPKKR
eukprot:1136971-Pelagomonas_calceolata.AAC.1